MKIIIAIENEAYNENIIDYYIFKNDKHFIRNYYKINRKKIVDYTINDRIIIIIYKIIDFDLIITKSF